mmetsp:Transcript_43270/g.92594  ORF Transcript_43270/g.92594 Transcript_43270/m.92594 type:complete len:303 (-) Transcript_43270:827-1735(-)
MGFSESTKTFKSDGLLNKNEGPPPSTTAGRSSRMSTSVLASRLGRPPVVGDVDPTLPRAPLAPALAAAFAAAFALAAMAFSCSAILALAAAAPASSRKVAWKGSQSAARPSSVMRFRARPRYSKPRYTFKALASFTAPFVEMRLSQRFRHRSCQGCCFKASAIVAISGRSIPQARSERLSKTQSPSKNMDQAAPSTSLSTFPSADSSMSAGNASRADRMEARVRRPVPPAKSGPSRASKTSATCWPLAPRASSKRSGKLSEVRGASERELPARRSKALSSLPPAKSLIQLRKDFKERSVWMR